ncbi:MAG: hypothetical protein ACOH2H_17885 [Cypionkella sp.]
MTAPLAHPLVAASSTADWMLDRLTEARGVLADTTQHPDSLVILAARVVAGQTDSARECADAIDLLCQLDRRPLNFLAAAAFPNGGSA